MGLAGSPYCGLILACYHQRAMDPFAPTAALLASFAVCWALLATRRAHEKLSIDDTIPGLQKVHKTPVPRIGGFGILAGVAAGTLVLGTDDLEWMALFLLAAIPAFAGGFLEDLTRKVSPYSRLLFAFGAAAGSSPMDTAPPS